MRRTITTIFNSWSDKPILARWMLVGLLAIFGSPPVFAAVDSDLFGTWDGTWFVDEIHDELNPPEPIAFQVDVQFNIGPFDPIEGNYGTILLDTTTPGVISSITVVGDNVELLIDYPSLNIAPGGMVKGILTGNVIVGDFDEVPTAGWVTGKGALEISKISTDPVIVDLSGTIKTAESSDICAMVLASGQFMFSCNPTGVFSLTDLPRETNGTVKRQIYADGFFPKVDSFTDSSNEAVVMTRSGTCPSYNIPIEPNVYPDSAGKWVNISGSVEVGEFGHSVCAMVLANGQHMFSCDGFGNYALNIPLDNNGQFKLQVYADGFAPSTQTFDEFQAINNVRMARAAECQ